MALKAIGVVEQYMIKCSSLELISSWCLSQPYAHLRATPSSYTYEEVMVRVILPCRLPCLALGRLALGRVAAGELRRLQRKGFFLLAPSRGY